MNVSACSRISAATLARMASSVTSATCSAYDAAWEQCRQPMPMSGGRPTVSGGCSRATFSVSALIGTPRTSGRWRIGGRANGASASTAARSHARGRRTGTRSRCLLTLDAVRVVPDGPRLVVSLHVGVHPLVALIPRLRLDLPVMGGEPRFGALDAVLHLG